MATRFRLRVLTTRFGPSFTPRGTSPTIVPPTTPVTPPHVCNPRTGDGGPNVDAQKITPTPAQWSAFRRALDAQKVWRWHGNYTKANATDTMTWSLKVEYADRSVVTAGAGWLTDGEAVEVAP